MTKIIGLKSAIVKEKEIILTGFGLGNETILEHQIIDLQPKYLAAQPSNDVKDVDAKKY